MSTYTITRIPILPFGMVNAHLIEGPKGCILVDTGLPASERKIETVLTRRGRTFKDIKLIIVTHAHVDHAGSAARLRELTGADLLAHEGDVLYYSREEEMHFCPTGWFGRLFHKTPLPFESYTGFRPDILLCDGDVFDLGFCGIPGKVRHTPGHTAGSISVELVGKDALIGDLVASGILLGGIIRTGHAIRPPFEDDPHVVGAELRRMVDAGMERFYVGHGGPLNVAEVRRHARALMAMKPATRAPGVPASIRFED